MTDLASLRIAEERVEWGVLCCRRQQQFDGREAAERYVANINVNALPCAPHRVVSRRVIVTEWAEADE